MLQPTIPAANIDHMNNGLTFHTHLCPLKGSLITIKPCCFIFQFIQFYRTCVKLCGNFELKIIELPKMFIGKCAFGDITLNGNELLNVKEVKRGATFTSLIFLFMFILRRQREEHKVLQYICSSLRLLGAAAAIITCPVLVLIRVYKVYQLCRLRALRSLRALVHINL